MRRYLKRMNRQYTCKEYADRCAILRKHFRNPGDHDGRHRGFPAETDADFETTRRFLEKVHFYEMHVFPYSRRAGTRADRMPDQVPEPVKKERSAVLLKLEKKMSGEYRSSFAGTEQEILLEEPVTINDEIYMTGYTKEYVKAAIRLDGRDPKAMENTFVSGILGGFSDRGDSSERKNKYFWSSVPIFWLKSALNWASLYCTNDKIRERIKNSNKRSGFDITQDIQITRGRKRDIYGRYQ